MKEYTWNLKGLAKGLDPQLAAMEFDRIEAVFGSLTPENILKAAEPPHSVFHNQFEWDDHKAAIQHRLAQARSLINNISVKLISDGKVREVAVFEITKSPSGKVYKSLFHLDEDDVEGIRLRTIRDLYAIQRKLRFYNRFTSSVSIIGSAINDLEESA